MNTRLRWALEALLALAVFQLMIVWAFTVGPLSPDLRPPISEPIIEALNSPIKAGSKLVVRSHREKVRDDCPVTSLRSATNIDTGITTTLPGRAWAGGLADEDYVDLEIDTTSLPPGNYQGTLNATYACPAFSYPVSTQFFFKVVQ